MLDAVLVALLQNILVVVREIGDEAFAPQGSALLRVCFRRIKLGFIHQPFRKYRLVMAGGVFVQLLFQFVADRLFAEHLDQRLAQPVFDERIGSVVARALTAADVLYARADSGIALLPRDCRVAIRAARLIYSDIGRGIARAEYDSVTRRAYVSGARKLWLVVRAMVGARNAARAREPELGAVTFLLRAAASEASA